MKRQFLLLFAIAVCAATLTTTASGQNKTLRTNVKFDFQIGDRTFPAGAYRIESLSRDSNNTLRIRSVGDANKNELFLANHSIGDKGQPPRLVFQKYGENYVLTKIFLDTEEWGYAVRPSRRQRESEQNLALTSRQTIEVRLANKKEIK